MTLEFLPAADQELAEATAHYEEAELGLGVRFREEVQSATAAILLHPLLWRQRRGSYRRVNLPGFPYYVAYVLRYGPASLVAQVSAAFSSCADTCPDDYQRGAVRAWQVRALAERGLVSQAEAALSSAVDFARRAEPPASRSEALFLLFEAGYPLGASSLTPLAVMLAEVSRAQPQRWRCSRALVRALAMLSVVAVVESDHLLRTIADERIRGRVARAIASGMTTPRPFFW